MWLLDQWAERHITEAQSKGEFDNLPGSGEPLILDDDSHVPPELRAGYRLLKNAGCYRQNLSSGGKQYSFWISSKVSVMMIRNIKRLVVDCHYWN